MSSGPKFKVTLGRLAPGGKTVTSDVCVVLKEDGSATVELHLGDGEETLRCVLTPEQAEALSQELIQAADRARFVDASPPRKPSRPRDLIASVKPGAKPAPRLGPRRP